MRRFFVLTLAGLLTLGAFAVGSALFAPAQSSAPTEAVPSLSIPAGRGEASGRLASASFVPSTFITEDEEAVLYSLLPDELEGSPSTTFPEPTTTTSTTAPPTTTTAAPPSATAAPLTTTTSPPTTTSTTTTLPPTTTTSSTTTTTLPPTTTTSSTTTTTLPPTTTTTTTPPATGPLTEAEMRELAARFFPAEEVEKAVLVAWCESNYDPSAYNPAGPYGGLFQHLETFWDSRAAGAGYPGASIFDAEANTAAAHLLWSSNGWSPWPSCSAWADGQL